MPQSHEPGAEAGVDFGEFHAVIAGTLDKPWIFVMRLSCSGRAFHVAFATQAQEAFLEGHVLAFGYFGAVPGRVRYDNLGPAAVRVLRGRDRAESERFIPLRSHYRFDSFYAFGKTVLHGHLIEARMQDHSRCAKNSFGRMARRTRLYGCTVGASDEVLFLALDPEMRRVIRNVCEHRNVRAPRKCLRETFAQGAIEVRHEGHNHIRPRFLPMRFEHSRGGAVVGANGLLENLH